MIIVFVVTATIFICFGFAYGFYSLGYIQGRAEQKKLDDRKWGEEKQ